MRHLFRRTKRDRPAPVASLAPEPEAASSSTNIHLSDETPTTRVRVNEFSGGTLATLGFDTEAASVTIYGDVPTLARMVESAHTQLQAALTLHCGGGGA